MSMFRNFFSNINPSTLSGAIDVVIIEQEPDPLDLESVSQELGSIGANSAGLGQDRDRGSFITRPTPLSSGASDRPVFTCGSDAGVAGTDSATLNSGCQMDTSSQTLITPDMPTLRPANSASPNPLVQALRRSEIISSSYANLLGFQDKANQVVATYPASPNPASLEVALERTFLSTPFHVRFGKFGVFHPEEKVVDISVNGRDIDWIHMRLSKNGDAYFRVDRDDDFDEPSSPGPGSRMPIFESTSDSVPNIPEYFQGQSEDREDQDRQRTITQSQLGALSLSSSNMHSRLARAQTEFKLGDLGGSQNLDASSVRQEQMRRMRERVGIESTGPGLDPERLVAQSMDRDRNIYGSEGDLVQSLERATTAYGLGLPAAPPISPATSGSLRNVLSIGHLASHSPSQTEPAAAAPKSPSQNGTPNTSSRKPHSSTSSIGTMSGSKEEKGRVRTNSERGDEQSTNIKKELSGSLAQLSNAFVTEAFKFGFESLSQPASPVRHSPTPPSTQVSISIENMDSEAPVFPASSSVPASPKQSTSSSSDLNKAVAVNIDGDGLSPIKKKPSSPSETRTSTTKDSSMSSQEDSPRGSFGFDQSSSGENPIRPRFENDFGNNDRFYSIDANADVFSQFTSNQNGSGAKGEQFTRIGPMPPPPLSLPKDSSQTSANSALLSTIVTTSTSINALSFTSGEHAQEVQNSSTLPLVGQSVPSSNISPPPSPTQLTAANGTIIQVLPSGSVTATSTDLEARVTPPPSPTSKSAVIPSTQSSPISNKLSTTGTTSTTNVSSTTSATTNAPTQGGGWLSWLSKKPSNSPAPSLSPLASGQDGRTRSSSGTVLLNSSTTAATATLSGVSCVTTSTSASTTPISSPISTSSQPTSPAKSTSISSDKSRVVNAVAPVAQSIGTAAPAPVSHRDSLTLDELIKVKDEDPSTYDRYLYSNYNANYLLKLDPRTPSANAETSPDNIPLIITRADISASLKSSFKPIGTDSDQQNNWNALSQSKSSSLTETSLSDALALSQSQRLPHDRADSGNESIDSPLLRSNASSPIPSLSEATTASSEKVLDMAISLCGPLEASTSVMPPEFESKRLSFEDPQSLVPEVLANPKAVIRFNERYYWSQGTEFQAIHLQVQFQMQMQRQLLVEQEKRRLSPDSLSMPSSTCSLSLSPLNANIANTMASFNTCPEKSPDKERVGSTDKSKGQYANNFNAPSTSTLTQANIAITIENTAASTGVSTSTPSTSLISSAALNANSASITTSASTSGSEATTTRASASKTSNGSANCASATSTCSASDRKSSWLFPWIRTRAKPEARPAQGAGAGVVSPPSTSSTSGASEAVAHKSATGQADDKEKGKQDRKMTRARDNLLVESDPEDMEGALSDSEMECKKSFDRKIQAVVDNAGTSANVNNNILIKDIASARVAGDVYSKSTLLPHMQQDMGAHPPVGPTLSGPSSVTPAQIPSNHSYSFLTALAMKSKSQESVAIATDLVGREREQDRLAPNHAALNMHATRSAASLSAAGTPIGTPMMADRNAKFRTQRVHPKREPRKHLTSKEITRLDLHPGHNEISYSVTSQYQGTSRLEASMYLWRYDDQLVISDVDGTVTRSDVLGHASELLGIPRDWTHNNVAELYSRIARNGYRLVYLSSRGLGLSTSTRDNLRKRWQGEFALPDGPVLLNPISLVQALKKEVIDKRPQEFKIACLSELRGLFPKTRQPLFAGFGNRETDTTSYIAVGIPMSRIFIINPYGVVTTGHHNTFRTSYAQLATELLDQVFPGIETHSQLPSSYPGSVSTLGLSLSRATTPTPQGPDHFGAMDVDISAPVSAPAPSISPRVHSHSDMDSFEPPELGQGPPQFNASRSLLLPSEQSANIVGTLGSQLAAPEFSTFRYWRRF